MYGKSESIIKKIKVKNNSFKTCPKEIEPTWVNFFFGKNGAGKSSVAEALNDKSNLEPKTGLDNYRFCIFDQDYIRTHTNYDNVEGVFTLGEIKVKNQKQIKENEEKINKLEAEEAELEEKQNQRQETFKGLKPALQEECRKLTATLRTKFNDTMTGWSKNPRLTEELLAVKTPKEHDRDELRKLCDKIFQSGGKTYQPFAMPADTDMTTLPGYDLLAKIITSSSDTPYATFIKKLNAGDWIKEGHDKYTHAADGYCPYCSRKLDDDFEEKFKACFDEEYKRDTAAISRLYDSYKTKTDGIISVLKGNLTDAYPKLKNLAGYRAKVTEVENVFQSNLEKIEDKKSSPSVPVTLEETDALFTEIGNLVSEINAEITDYNNTVTSTEEKEKCINQVKELFAFTVQVQLDTYNNDYKRLGKEIKDIETKRGKLSEEIKKLEDEITVWRNTSGGTEEAAENINRHLLSSGFQSFRLEKKPGEKDVYFVKRYDGTTVKKLSEGEQNFIAFLFFNEEVHGKQSQDDELINKIVVIDDPVSSMDSNSVFIVSALVRTMINICLNNVSNFAGEEVQNQHIKQIFILTHNAFFHNEITQHREADFDHVAFFTIEKKTTVSDITMRVKEKKGSPTEEWVNVNPVQNSYKALWQEYKELESPIPLMSVMRRILEYYFVQLGGYDSDKLEEQIFSEQNVKDYFEDVDENGKKSYFRKEIAESAIRHIMSGTYGFNDGEDITFYEDMDACRKAFEGIFNSMNQGQHYKKMMG